VKKLNNYDGLYKNVGHNPDVNPGDFTPLPPLRQNGDGVAFPKFQKYGVQAMETRIRQNGNAMN